MEAFFIGRTSTELGTVQRPDSPSFKGLGMALRDIVGGEPIKAEFRVHLLGGTDPDCEKNRAKFMAGAKYSATAQYTAQWYLYGLPETDLSRLALPGRFCASKPEAEKPQGFLEGILDKLPWK